MIGLLLALLQLFLLALLARIILSWFPATGGALDSVQRVLFRITEPVLAPVRAILPPVRLGGMALDLSPIVVFILLQLLIGFLAGL
ncbi:YggT family protein [Rhabdothermincola salaria]|uniref:YggT family protein n=1 Tax=Rhabdothermincola salaria TaxID=2903142 RepID=UPI001E52B27D|nr:YggT family protein [Rhabdothermincola salaria]